MTAAELRRRIEKLEAEAPAEPAPDPELAAKFEAMTDQQLDAWLEAYWREKSRDPEWVRQQEEHVAFLESLTDQQLEMRMRWLCTDPRHRGQFP